MADNLLDKASILLTPTAYNDGSMLSIKPENGDGDFTFSRAGNASRVNSAGNIVTESANIPRIDYTDGCGSWLLEPQSTNLITYSEDFGQSYWNLAGGDKTSGQLSPNGDNSAYRIDFNGSDIGNFFRSADITLTADTTYTASWYIKNINLNDTTRFRIETISGGGTGAVNIDTLQDYGTIPTDKFTRYSITFTTGNASGQYRVRVMQAGSSNNTNSFIIANAQTEQQSYATSYIPTNGAANTRLQDIANNSGNSSLINSTEGVLYAEIAALADDLNIEGISISDGSISNRVVIFKWSNSNSIRARVSSNGINVLNQTFSVSDITDFNKIAISYKLNEFKVYINGTNVFNGTSGAVPIGLNTLSFDTDGTSFTPFYGKVKAPAVFPILTDAELQSLTTI